MVNISKSCIEKGKSWLMEKQSMFNSEKLPLKIDKPIRLIELFAGIGSQAKALRRLGVEFEHYRICEFDKYAIKSYNIIHGTDFVTSDITQITAADLGIVDTDKYCYIMTYSFPCQDLSLAGKQKGMAKGENTRSGLLWEVERLINECTELPQILLMENVTQVHGKKNKEHFNEWITFLESKGYSNYWKDLNAKNFGIPQNRNRTFMVSILGDYTYEFPEEFPLELRLKDMLEDSVDEKFYISNDQMEKIVNWKAQQKPFERVLGRESISQTLTARGAGENHSGMIIYSPENENTTNMQSEVKAIVNGDVCKTVRAGGKGSLDRHSWDLVAEPKVLAGIGEKKSNGGTQWYQQDRIYDGESVAISVTTGFNPFYKVDEPKLKKVCQLDGAFKQSGRVYNADGLSPTIMSNSHGKTNGGYTSPKVVVEGYDPFIVASRGRNPENPSDRTPGIPLKQRLEANLSGCTNTLTTVQKDNYVVEPFINVVGNYSPSGHDASRIVAVNGLAPTVKENHGTVTAVVELKERFFKQALETLENNDCSVGDTIDAYNKKANKSGISPTITTRPEGFKTAILPVVEANTCLIQPKDRNYKAKNQPRETHVEMKKDGVSHALRTNAETMVMEPIVCEQRKDEGLRFFKGGCVGTLRTIDACGDKRVIEPTISKIDIPQTVRVRKYEVDSARLCEVLRNCKRSSGLKNQDIAEILNVPLTKVAHWFRQDKCFAIPDEDIWFKLKSLLCIDTDEFDTAIMTFEEKEGVFEKSNRCYFSNGIAPTITSAGANEKVVDPQIIREEPLEREGWHEYAKEVLSSEGLCRTLSTQSNNLATKVKEPYSLRIRKLTPKECWRLMGFDDVDFEKATTVNSNSQLYKQAGNSIVVDVLCYIFSKML